LIQGQNATTLSQTSQNITITIDERETNSSTGDMNISIDVGIEFAPDVSPTRSATYTFSNAAGMERTVDVVIGHTAKPAFQNLPARFTNLSVFDLDASGGGYDYVSVYAREDNGDWDILEMNGADRTPSILMTGSPSQTST
jgi:hypothetical protein